MADLVEIIKVALSSIFVFRKSSAICVSLIAIMQLRLLSATSVIRKAKYIVDKDARIIQSIGISAIDTDRSLVQCGHLFISTEDIVQLCMTLHPELVHFTVPNVVP